MPAQAAWTGGNRQERAARRASTLDVHEAGAPKKKEKTFTVIIVIVMIMIIVAILAQDCMAIWPHGHMAFMEPNWLHICRHVVS